MKSPNDLLAAFTSKKESKAAERLAKAELSSLLESRITISQAALLLGITEYQLRKAIPKLPSESIVMLKNKVGLSKSFLDSILALPEPSRPDALRAIPKESPSHATPPSGSPESTQSTPLPPFTLESSTGCAALTSLSAHFLSALIAFQPDSLDSDYLLTPIHLEAREVDGFLLVTHPVVQIMSRIRERERENQASEADQKPLIDPCINNLDATMNPYNNPLIDTHMSDSGKGNTSHAQALSQLMETPREVLAEAVSWVLSRESPSEPILYLTLARLRKMLEIESTGLTLETSLPLFPERDFDPFDSLVSSIRTHLALRQRLTNIFPYPEIHNMLSHLQSLHDTPSFESFWLECKADLKPMSKPIWDSFGLSLAEKKTVVAAINESFPLSFQLIRELLSFTRPEGYVDSIWGTGAEG